MQRVEPELDIVRRVAPFGVPAALLALALGAVVGDFRSGISASLGVIVVFLNFIANGVILARAARVSVTFLFGAATLGFVIRMAVVLAFMFFLNQFDWFSPVAFAAGLVPTLIVLLIWEAKLVSGPIGQQWQIPEEQPTR